MAIEFRINQQIRAREVLLIAENGEPVGTVGLAVALGLAAEAGLDLVEVAPEARPPVCRIQDFGRLKYEDSLKERAARKARSHQSQLKEMKFRPKIDPHDYATKRGRVADFLGKGDRVKVTVMFRGREQSRPEIGVRLLERLAQDLAEVGTVISSPNHEGRNMTIVFAPARGAQPPAGS